MQDQDSGSPASGEPEFLAIGKLRRPHGVRGEILMSVWTDFPERMKPGVKVYVGDSHSLHCIRSVRWHRDDLLIAFDAYTTREQVGILRNQIVMVRVDDRPALEDGGLYLHRLLGMKVIEDEGGKLLGKIAEIIETGANDVYVVQCEDGSDLLLPAIDPVILDINLENNEVRVHLLPGLLVDD